MRPIDVPSPGLLRTYRGIPEKLRHPLAQPQGNPAEIQVQQRMCIFVIDGVVRGRALRIQSQNHVIFVAVAVKQPRGTNVPLSTPLLGSQHLHRRFVARRQDHDRLRRINPQFRKCVVKQRPNLLEVFRDSPRVHFIRIACHHEMCAAHLDPMSRLVCRKQIRRGYHDQ